MKKPKMKLSQAIRRGCQLVPQTTGLNFRFDATTEDWVQRRQHTKPLLGCDALGTALIGLAGDVGKAIERSYGLGRSPLAIIYELYPFLMEMRRQCPVCLRKASWAPPVPMVLSGLTWHVQDVHKWSREQVADYLETLEVS